MAPVGGTRARAGLAALLCCLARAASRNDAATSHFTGLCIVGLFFSGALFLSAAITAPFPPVCCYSFPLETLKGPFKGAFSVVWHN